MDNLNIEKLGAEHKISIGISSCLLGHKVRFDSGHKQNSYINNTLSEYFDFVPFCPEVDIGLGIPREAIRLVLIDEKVHCLGSKTADLDVTQQLKDSAKQQFQWQKNLSGYILKKDSPSCGMERVRLYKGNMPDRIGVGIYAQTLMDSTVNSNTVGTYTITYTATDESGNQATAQRQVVVPVPSVPSDTAAPVITLTGSATINLEQGTTYTEAGATASDAVDGVLVVTTTGTVNSNTVGSYTITYTATDGSGNQATAQRQVVVSVPPDTTAPVITLTGSATINLEQGTTYTEAGATATDAVDGVITVTTTGTVDTNTIGTYTVTYTATDVSGNQATAQRQVVVSALIVLNTPINIKLTLGGVGEITASWDAVTEAIKYQLCVAEEAIVTFSECVATHSGALTEETGITQQITALTSGTNYYFRVMALDDSGHLSLASVEVESKVLLKTLNDTGIYWGGNYPSGNNADCTGVEITQQDCSHGRDAQAAANTLTKIGAGAVGFDFTKLDVSGTALNIQNLSWNTAGSEANGTQWACVKDNHTGLIWEVKTDVGAMDKINNIHHKDNTYQWGGTTAIGKTASAPFGTYYDDWNGLVDGSNASNLCGFSDWRVPTLTELHSIIHSGVFNPSIDTGYFPNTVGSGYWSSSPAANYSNGARQVIFSFGFDVYGNLRRNTYYVRLVRSGQ